ncbi:MAG: hypothetical protein Q4A06_08670 [Cardiobacteriaceae bacterium]|nr:hypothetical protein [Cardiobacteriaceae bacterium]
MSKGAYLIVAMLLIGFGTVVNYSLVDPQAGSRTHSGGTVFVPSGGGFSSGSHK